MKGDNILLRTLLPLRVKRNTTLPSLLSLMFIKHFLQPDNYSIFYFFINDFRS